MITITAQAGKINRVQRLIQINGIWVYITWPVYKKIFTVDGRYKKGSISNKGYYRFVLYKPRYSEELYYLESMKRVKRYYSINFYWNLVLKFIYLHIFKFQ